MRDTAILDKQNALTNDVDSVYLCILRAIQATDSLQMSPPRINTTEEVSSLDERALKPSSFEPQSKASTRIANNTGMRVGIPQT